MAAYHGEIMLPSSRAVDEEDEEDEVPTLTCVSPYTATWSKEATEEMKTTGGVLKCSTLVVAIGPAPTGFVEAYMLGDGERSKLASVRTQRSDDLAHSGEDSSVLRLQQLPHVLFVQCDCQVMPEQTFSWTQAVLGKITPEVEAVVILSTSPLAEYKTPSAHSDMPAPFLRALSTERVTVPPVCPYLEQPNTVAGLPAQVLTYCEVNRLPGVLYQCTTDTMYLDIHTIKAFSPILTTAPFQKFSLEQSRTEEKLRDLVQNQNKQNAMLYI